MKKIMVLELEVYIFCFVQYLYAFFLLYIYNNNKVYLYKAFILFHPSQMTYYYTCIETYLCSLEANVVL